MMLMTGCILSTGNWYSSFTRIATLTTSAFEVFEINQIKEYKTIRQSSIMWENLETNGLTWADKEQTKRWQAVEGCHQAKMFLDGSNRRLTHFIPGLRKHHLQYGVYKMTHYTQLVGKKRKHLFTFWWKCYATVLIWHRILWAYTLCRISPSNVF